MTRRTSTRRALRELLAKHNAGQFERQHRRGCEKRLARREEFRVWETEWALGGE